MAVKKENFEAESEPASNRPIELITENGFSIVRAGELEGARPSPAGTYEFVVSDEQGNQFAVTVEFDRKIVIEIIFRTRGRLSSESSYWISCAERHLADYLWEHDGCPPNGKLQIELLTPTDINLAIRWKAN